MSSRNNDNKIRKTLLTPCRSVGLKRKSLGSTPRSGVNQSPCTPKSTISNSSNVQTNVDVTPVTRTDGTPVSHLEKRIKLQHIKTKKLLDNEPEKPSTDDEEDIDTEIEKLKERIAEKTSKINVMELETKNVKQHNLNDLNSLITKWRHGCQTALKELLSEFQKRDSNCSMVLLLRKLGIPFELVHFSESELDFQN